MVKSKEAVKKRIEETTGDERREYEKLLNIYDMYGYSFFAFDNVDVFKMACGHYEILQYVNPESVATDRPKCTGCMSGLGWK